jgi:hypothetical protein
MWQQHDLVYQMVMQEQQARIDAAERRRQAHLARSPRNRRSAQSFLAALQRIRAGRSGTHVRDVVTQLGTSEDRVATA